ncbi:hypothetical protein RI129_004528 [Pyrocoelia pectoralis]|uniref:Sodium/calcium exchanger membrane region domain-containing protein n=1 Tax=Pyrocoelia pectoralis TaxID=417401 RepID=A0AAN7VL47_9COLE
MENIKILRSDSDNYNSADDFPKFLTDDERKNGAILLPFIIGIYCFTLLALVCDKYFLPCVGKICEFLNLSQNVAAATFMAMATSSPELFVNIVSTFITESDLGIGTITGSSMFNTLGVAAVGSLAARTPIQLDWWPVTRDSFLYLVSIILLVSISWDGKVFWYDGVVLFVACFIYFIIMFNNNRISKFGKGLFLKLQKKLNSSTVTPSPPTTLNLTPQLYLVEEHTKCLTQFNTLSGDKNTKCDEDPAILYDVTKTADVEKKIGNEAINLCCQKFLYFYTWPLKALLFCIVPDPVKRPKLFPITFIICVLIIGANSYLISWMLTIIGKTFHISDTVLGFTFLAAGGCLPEAISITIMSRRGEGSMGISNSLGANSMNILMSLGLPWFIKTLIVKNDKGKFIEITSGAIEYTILSLILVIISLFITLYFNDFKLQKKTGIALIVIYLIFLSCNLASEIILVDS